MAINLDEQQILTQDVQMVDMVIPWVKDEKDFLPAIRAGEWIVTEENELTFSSINHEHRQHLKF